MENKNSKKDRIHTFIDDKLLKFLDIVLHFIIFALIVALIVVIIFELYNLFFVRIFQGDIRIIIDHILFTFILIELFTILYSYLKKHYIKVERVIEVGIISIVREVMFKVFEVESTKIYAISVLLLVFGAIFFIEKRFSKERNV